MTLIGLRLEVYKTVVAFEKVDGVFCISEHRLKALLKQEWDLMDNKELEDEAEIILTKCITDP